MENTRALKILAPDRFSISVMHRFGQKFDFGIIEQKGFEIDVENAGGSSLSEEEILQRMFLIEHSQEVNIDLIITGYSMTFLPLFVGERVLKYAFKVTNFQLLGTKDQRRSETRIFIHEEEWNLDRVLHLAISPYQDYIGLPSPFEFSFFPDDAIHRDLENFVVNSLRTFAS